MSGFHKAELGSCLPPLHPITDGSVFPLPANSTAQDFSAQALVSISTFLSPSPLHSVCPPIKQDCSPLENIPPTFVNCTWMACSITLNLLERVSNVTFSLNPSFLTPSQTLVNPSSMVYMLCSLRHIISTFYHSYWSTCILMLDGKCLEGAGVMSEMSLYTLLCQAARALCIQTYKEI